MSYIDYLLDSFILEKAKRYDVKGRDIFQLLRSIILLILDLEMLDLILDSKKKII